MQDESWLLKTIEPKSDQLNADDLLSGPVVVKILSVKEMSDEKQPVAIAIEGYPGRPYKPCLTMRRVLLNTWGAVPWAGRYLKLFCDQSVKFNNTIGGIRISNVSHISEPVDTLVAVSRNKRVVYRVEPLPVNEQPKQVDPVKAAGGQGGKYVNEPGIYHVCWTAVDENPTKRDGTPIDGTQLSLEVLAGTNASQAGKSLDIMLFNPRETDKATVQDLAKRRKFAFAYSTCLVGHDQPGKKSVVDVQQAVGRQSVVKVARKQKEENGKYVDDPTGRIELSWADIYHVDDPWVEKNSVPLSGEFIAMIPASLRKEKPQTATSAVSAAGVAGATAGQVNGHSQPGMVAAAAVDVGDV